jgi:hypothetical protein
VLEIWDSSLKFLYFKALEAPPCPSRARPVTWRADVDGGQGMRRMGVHQRAWGRHALDILCDISCVF